MSCCDILKCNARTTKRKSPALVAQIVPLTPSSYTAPKHMSQKKTSPGKDASAKSQEHSINFECARTCLDSFRILRSGGEKYFTELAALLGIDKATLHRRLHRFESLIQEKGGDDFRLITRGQGTKASANSTPKIEQLVADLAQVIEAWDRITSDWGTRRTIVRLGSSLSASRFFIPFLSRDFPDVDFDTSHSRPRRLLELSQRKLCDLVLTVVPSDYEDIHTYDANSKKKLRWCREMNMKVIAPRGHFTETESWTIDTKEKRIQLWKRMAEEGQTLCLLRDEPDRYPMAHLPTEELPSELRVHRVGSTQMLEAMVLSSDPDYQHVTISLPHFLRQDDREKLHVIDAELDYMRIGLLRPHKEGEKEPENEHRTKKINEIEKRIINTLNSLIDQDEHPVTEQKHYYHLTRKGNRHVWVRGDIWWTIKTIKDAQVRGERIVSGRYRIEVDGETHHYLVSGRILIKQTGQCHLVCRMTSIGDAFIDEFSVSSIFANEKELQNAAIGGIWMGTTAWNQDSAEVHEDYRGCAVISSSELKVAQLEKIALDYKENQKIGEPIFSSKELYN